MRTYACAPAILLTCCAFVSAGAYEYQPLTLGAEWEFRDAQQISHTIYMLTEEEILGTLTKVRRHVEPDQVYENFWTTDEDGHLYLHGVRNVTFGEEWAYLPPIRYIDAPLYLGKFWVTENVVMYTLEGTPCGNPFNIGFQVCEEGPLVVPAGVFYSYGIDATFVGMRPPDTYSLLGRHGARDGATEWFCDGTGLTQYLRGSPDPFQLVSFSIPGTAVESSTWGRIKALFAP